MTFTKYLLIEKKRKMNPHFESADQNLVYITIYTNLKLKTKYLYKNKWEQKSAWLRGSRSSL